LKHSNQTLPSKIKKVAVEERRAYDLSLIYTGDEEFCFEEIRARGSKYQVRAKKTAKATQFKTMRVKHLFVGGSIGTVRS